MTERDNGLIDVASKRAQAWVAAELVRYIGLQEYLASQIARESLDRSGSLSRYPSLNSVEYGQYLVGASADVISVARATEMMPDGRAYWYGPALQPALNALKAGQTGAAYAIVAEALAEPAPDVIDTNWMPDKIWQIAVPPGSRPGHEFVLGNGEGMRARLRVEERDGVLGSVVAEWTDSLGPLFKEAKAEATRLLFLGGEEEVGQ